MAVYHRIMKYALILLAAPLCVQSIDQLEGHGDAISSIQYEGKRAVQPCLIVNDMKLGDSEGAWRFRLGRAPRGISRS
jgi:hypothetical protein